MSQEIKSVLVPFGTDGVCYEVGFAHVSTIEHLIVRHINITTSTYACKDSDGKLIATIENCPVVVEYKR